MAVRTVLRMGNPILRQVAEPVLHFNSKPLDALVTDMFDTMAQQNGAGLAAPQIGESVRLVVFGVGENPRYPEAEVVPVTVLINPEIEVIGDEVVGGWEGCLSVPGMRGLVYRPERIRYSGYDQTGQRIEREVDGFHARVVQHECDHLDGILYPQRLKDLRYFGFEDELFNNSDD